ncbi:MAG: sugar phosphate isomerase/epimerase family protein [Merdibacter sp.]
MALVGPHQDPKKTRAICRRSCTGRSTWTAVTSASAHQRPDNFLRISYAKATEQMQQFLTMAAQTAAPHHISILYEALHPYTCNFGNHTAEIRDTVRTLQLANLHMVWDVYHAFLSGEDFTPAISCMKEIRHVHVCGWDEARNRYYLSETDAPLIHDLFAF